jgi:hypothetical protein
MLDTFCYVSHVLMLCSSLAGGGQMTPLEKAHLAERISKWETSCDPRIVAGRNGIKRYIYAHADCEYGSE